MIRAPLQPIALLALSTGLLSVAAPAARAETRTLHVFDTVALSPDGRHVASVEHDDRPVDGLPPASLTIRDEAGGAVAIALPCGHAEGCTPSDPVWSRDGRQLDFLLERPDGTTAIETVGIAGGTPTQILDFDGPLDQLRIGHDGRVAVLATAHATKRVGATAAAAPLAGEVGTRFDEQRIAIVEHGALRFVSPHDLYVYEYDWRPDGGFVGTAAHGNGDSDWWIAGLYAFRDGSAKILFQPAAREQLATPRVAPDGRSVAFVGGWMSDFGSTGGDAYTLSLDDPRAHPVDLTPGLAATVTALDWGCGHGLTAALLAQGETRIASLHDGRVDIRARTPDSWSAGGWNQSVSCGGGRAATVRESFTAPPEIVAGPIGAFRAITDANAGISTPVGVRSLTWIDDGRRVQGWLLAPEGAGQAKRPMVVDVHGGPEAAATPEYPRARGGLRALLDAGYAVLQPNYRGSFGQGEGFASASIGDLGGGDWRDVLSGVDAAERADPTIDDRRLGIIGGSYGGYMTMWAVTQTHRFRAGVAISGVSDWLSIEGEAPQAGSDEVNFGGSVYDNATPYLRASPIMHMRGVATPVLIAVGDRDVECPLPQSEEFHTALAALGVPSSFVVYPGEGHGFRKQADRDDLNRRSVAWFAHWFGTGR